MEPWYEQVLLAKPERVRQSLAAVEAAGLVERTPNTWQVCQGVLRMWHRLLFRSDTVGTCRDFPVRPGMRARLLQNRALRLPFLLRERAVAPLDFSGMASSRERVMKHLLGAHHDRQQAVYDLQMLSVQPGALEELLERVEQVLDDDSARSRWLRDLVVYERYHENLHAVVCAALDGTLELEEPDRSDPDVAFTAYLDWCAAQPDTPGDTMRRWLTAPEARGDIPTGRLTRDDVLALDRAQLLSLVRRGGQFDTAELAGRTYRGVSLAQPQLIEQLTWKKFQKVFYRDGGRLMGHNVRLMQNGLDADDVPRHRQGVPHEFGYFQVRRTDRDTPWCPAGLDAALLDYGLGDNPALDPTRCLRDPLVAVNAGSAELLLGYSYVELGPARFGTPTFFVLSAS